MLPQRFTIPLDSLDDDERQQLNYLVQRHSDSISFKGTDPKLFDFAAKAPNSFQSFFNNLSKEVEVVLREGASSEATKELERLFKLLVSRGKIK